MVQHALTVKVQMIRPQPAPAFSTGQAEEWMLASHVEDVLRTWREDDNAFVLA
ncbi:MAG: hypothetical protein ABL894_13845 [Hyphomicrobium sp.]